MHTPHSYRRIRARCSALRSIRSAVLALFIIALPKLIFFVEHGIFTVGALKELAQSVSVAALMVLFNYVQRLREKEASSVVRRQAMRRRDGS